jgi:glycine betaine/proline transport system ATP-binding protein
VNEAETLSNLIQMAIDHDSAIVVEDAGKDIGVITRQDILRTVIEGTEMS